MNDYVVQKASEVEPIPVGFNSVTPFLVVSGAEKLLDFVKAAFNAETISLMKEPSGKIMHASFKIGSSIVMLTDASDKMEAMPCMLYLYVDDVDHVYQQAINAGGQSLREPTDEFYGDRSAGVKDAWNNQWWVATHIEDVSTEELNRRAEALYYKTS